MITLPWLLSHSISFAAMRLPDGTLPERGRDRVRLEAICPHRTRAVASDARLGASHGQQWQQKRCHSYSNQRGSVGSVITRLNS